MPPGRLQQCTAMRGARVVKSDEASEEEQLYYSQVVMDAAECVMRCYAARASDAAAGWSFNAACAAASRATGTRNGEQDT